MTKLGATESARDLTELRPSTNGFHLTALPDMAAAGGRAKDPKKLAEAAKQFEALMITQMMKSARDSSGGGWLNDGDETGEDSSMGMAEEQFAQAMASSGGLGLAKMVLQTMSHATDNQESAATTSNGSIPKARNAVTNQDAYGSLH